MNFMQWLNSLDELLYEIMSWLVFFPVTLWRAVTRPLTMMNYADLELRDKPEEQFTDTLSPPLFLVIALIVSHGVELGLGGGVNPIVTSNVGLATLVTDNSTLLLLRLVTFAVFPLMLAVRLLSARKVALNRNRLRAPFYAQCYAAGPFALFLGLGVSLAHAHQGWASTVGPILIVISLVAYVAVQAAWFARHLGCGLLRGLMSGLIGLLAGGVLVIFIGWIFAGGAVT